jgi:uncharacterized protein YqkB
MDDRHLQRTRQIVFPECIQPQDTAAQQNNVAQVVNGESFHLKHFLQGQKVNDQQLANDTATNGNEKSGIRKDIQLVKAYTGRTADIQNAHATSSFPYHTTTSTNNNNTDQHNNSNHLRRIHTPPSTNTHQKL